MFSRVLFEIRCWLYCQRADRKESEMRVIDDVTPRYAFMLALKMLGFDPNVIEDVMSASYNGNAPKLTGDGARVYAVLKPLLADMREIRTDLVPPYFVKADRHISRTILDQKYLGPVSDTVKIANFFRRAYREETGASMGLTIPNPAMVPIPDWPSDNVPVRIDGHLSPPEEHMGHVLYYPLNNVKRGGCIYRISDGVIWVFQRTRPDETEIDGLWHCAAFLAT